MLPDKNYIQQLEIFGTLNYGLIYMKITYKELLTGLNCVAIAD